MSLQGISTYGGYRFNSLNTKESETESSKESASNALREMTGQSSGSGSTSASMSALSRMQTILSRIPKDDDGRLTFSDAKQYKKLMETDFRDKVSKGLRKLGVDENVEFTLKIDPATGSMKVNSSHPDKEKIEAFFEANPDLVSQFEEIQVLEGATKYTERKVPVSQIRREIQLQSASFWNSDETDLYASMSSVFYKYGGGNFSSMGGLNTFV
jgi:hypothetical protein